MFCMVSGWDPSQILGEKTGKPWETCEFNDCEKLLQVVSLLWKLRLWHIMTYWMGKSRNMITIKDLWQSPSGTRTSSRKDLFRVPVVLFEGQHPRHWCLRIQAWSQGHKRTIKPLFNKALQKSLEIRDTNFKRNNETKSNKSKQRNNQLINKQYAHLSLSLSLALSLSLSLHRRIGEFSCARSDWFYDGQVAESDITVTAVTRQGAQIFCLTGPTKTGDDFGTGTSFQLWAKRIQPKKVYGIWHMEIN